MNDGMAMLCQRCQVIAAKDRFPASTEMLENGEITLDLNYITEDEPEIVKGWRAFRGIKRTIARDLPFYSTHQLIPFHAYQFSKLQLLSGAISAIS